MYMATCPRQLLRKSNLEDDEARCVFYRAICKLACSQQHAVQSYVLPNATPAVAMLRRQMCANTAAAASESCPPRASSASCQARLQSGTYHMGENRKKLRSNCRIPTTTLPEHETMRLPRSLHLFNNRKLDALWTAGKGFPETERANLDVNRTANRKNQCRLVIARLLHLKQVYEQRVSSHVGCGAQGVA